MPDHTTPDIRTDFPGSPPHQGDSGSVDSILRGGAAAWESDGLPPRLTAESRPVFPVSSMQHLVDTLRLEPVVRSWEHRSPRSDAEVSMMEASAIMSEAIRRSGVPVSRLHDTYQHRVFPLFRVLLDDAAIQTMGELGAIYGTQGPLDRHYNLWLQEDGRLSMGYQQILGSRPLGVVPKELMEQLKTRMGQQIAERDVHYLRMLELDRGQAPAASEAANAAQQAKTARRVAGGAARKREGGEAIGDGQTGVLREMEMLSVEGLDVRLPESHLARYADVKRAMLKAGFSYRRDQQGSLFRAPAGTDVADVMRRLCAGEDVSVKQSTQFLGKPGSSRR